MGSGNRRSAGAGSRAHAPRSRRAWRPRVKTLTAAAFSVVALAVAALVWLFLVYAKAEGPGRGREVEIEIAPEASLDDVVEALRAHGAIDSDVVFECYARLRGAPGRLRRGTIVLRDDSSPERVLQRIATGFGSGAVKVVIPEGFNRFDVARRLERAGVCGREAFVGASSDAALVHSLGVPGATAEGYLFPDTYSLRLDMDAGDVVRRLVANFRRRVEPVLDAHAPGLAALRHDLGWSAHDALTLASIVEKEARVDEERPIIAGVFLNRMRSPGFLPRRLQADPTAAYGCLAMPSSAPSCAGFDGHHVTHDLVADARNPYNTYKVDGLPPGPISNPGLESIRAVLAPAVHRYFYFVAKGGGRHRFSETLDAHNDAVRDQARAQAPQAP